jgi:hypothetical protein
MTLIFLYQCPSFNLCPIGTWDRRRTCRHWWWPHGRRPAWLRLQASAELQHTNICKVCVTRFLELLFFQSVLRIRIWIRIRRIRMFLGLQDQQAKPNSLLSAANSFSLTIKLAGSSVVIQGMANFAPPQRWSGLRSITSSKSAPKEYSNLLVSYKKWV